MELIPEPDPDQPGLLVFLGSKKIRNAPSEVWNLDLKSEAIFIFIH